MDAQLRRRRGRHDRRARGTSLIPLGFPAVLAVLVSVLCFSSPQAWPLSTGRNSFEMLLSFSPIPRWGDTRPLALLDSLVSRADPSVTSRTAHTIPRGQRTHRAGGRGSSSASSECQSIHSPTLHARIFAGGVWSSLRSYALYVRSTSTTAVGLEGLFRGCLHVCVVNFSHHCFIDHRRRIWHGCVWRRIVIQGEHYRSFPGITVMIMCPEICASPSSPTISDGV